MALLRLDQQDRQAPGQGRGRAPQHREFVAFDVDLDEADVAERQVVEPGDGNLDAPRGRPADLIGRLQGRQTALAIGGRKAEGRRPGDVRHRLRHQGHPSAVEALQQSDAVGVGLHRDHVGAGPQQGVGVDAGVGADVHRLARRIDQERQQIEFALGAPGQQLGGVDRQPEQRDVAEGGLGDPSDHVHGEPFAAVWRPGPRRNAAMRAGAVARTAASGQARAQARVN